MRFLLLLLLLPLAARAQEAIGSDAATQPGVGTFVARGQYRFFQYADDLAEHEALAIVNYGVAPRLALTFELPHMVSVYDGDATSGASVGHGHGGGGGAGGEVETTTAGFDDLLAFAKYRFFQRDFGPIDTLRFSVLGGASFPVGDNDFSSDSVDPIVGVVGTYISGRFGANAALRHRFNSGDADDSYVTAGQGPRDATTLDAAALWRLAPAWWTRAGQGGLYAVLEGNVTYEANGDWQARLSPGVMWEAPGYALELSVGLPAYQDLSDRPELEWSAIVGFRALF